MLCGLAANFWQLFIMRVGVAVGEAGGVPPSQSMITDHYPPEQRATAMAIFSSATFIGSLIAFVGGAYIAENYGWRTAFLVVGAPGILLALVLRFTTEEPERGRYDEAAKGESKQQNISETLRAMWAVQSMRYILIGCGFASMAGYALGYWTPSFMIRVHELTIQQAGNLIGTVGISCGLFGSIFGAILCDRLARNNRRWMLFMPALSLLLSLPLMLLFLYWPQSDVTQLGNTTIPNAIWLFCLASLFGSWWAAPTYVAIQEAVAPDQRTLACAILLFVMNFAGFGLGPFLVGLASDFFTPQYGHLAIRVALMLMMGAYVIAMIFYYLAGREFIAHQSQAEPDPLPA